MIPLTETKGSDLLPKKKDADELATLEGKYGYCMAVTRQEQCAIDLDVEKLAIIIESKIDYAYGHVNMRKPASKVIAQALAASAKDWLEIVREETK